MLLHWISLYDTFYYQICFSNRFPCLGNYYTILYYSWQTSKAGLATAHRTGNSMTFRCNDGHFYVALGSSMGLALLVWVGGGLLKRVLYFFGNEPSLGQKSPILHLPLYQMRLVSSTSSQSDSSINPC